MSDDFFDDLNDLAPESESYSETDNPATVESGLSKLASLVEDLNRDLKVSAILDRAMDAAIELTGAERGFLVLVSESGSWDFRVARNMDKREIENAETAASHTVIRKVLEGRKPILINDVIGASDISKQQSIANMRVRSIMGAPLIAKGELRGAAYVDTAKLAGVFDETNLVLFETFVQLAAVALENARLIEAEQEASAQNRELQEYLDTILRSQPHGVIILDSSLCIEYVNPQAVQLIEDPQLARGARLTDVKMASEEESLRMLADLHDFLEKGMSRHSILDHSGKSLACSFFEVQKTHDGRSRVGVILEDVSVQRELEHKLIESEKRSTVNQLAGGIAHEINNSLQPVKGRVELLGIRLQKAGIGLSDGIGKDIETIDTLITRIEKIVRNLRHLSKPAKPDFEPLDLRTLILSTMDLLENTTGKLRGFKRDDPNCPYRIELDVDDELPLIVGEQHGLESALINMILNSSHAIKDKPSGVLRVCAHGDNDKIVVSVEDTGAGMPPDVLARVFEPYFTTKGNNEGTGLGMCIVQNVADIHNAKLDLESVLGEGTKITLTFPLFKDCTVTS